MLFSVVTKNLKWKILTKNIVTFQRWDEFKDGKLQYYVGSLKNLRHYVSLDMKTLTSCHRRRSGVFIVNFCFLVLCFYW